MKHLIQMMRWKPKAKTRAERVMISSFQVNQVLQISESKFTSKLDHSKIKGLENISPFLLNSPVDKGNQYTIPYF